MSADNWAICPQCKKNHENLKEKHQEAIKNQYGKIPIDEWLKLKNTQISELPQTLREDYHIGFYEGEFEIQYSATCDVCKFHFEFNFPKDNQ
jgi:hypothetical protein